MRSTFWFHVFTAVTLVALTVAPAGAILVCNDAIPLECGSTVDYPAPVNTDITSLCGAPVISCNAAVYPLTLASEQLISVSSSNNFPHLYILGSCNDNDCLASSVDQGSAVVTACLPAGDYFIVATQETCAYFPGTVTVTCKPCSPVPAAETGWGRLKAIYD